MALKILLLDCSKKLLTRLKRQGLDVESGSLGYATGVKKLLRPIYEHDVFIYNPTTFSDGIVTQFGLNAEDKSPEYNFYEITRCVNRGATILAFTNKITDNLRHPKMALPQDVNPQKLYDTLIEREKMMPTTIGKGIAFPHPRSPVISDVHQESVSIVFPERPFQYQSIDGCVS